VHAGAADVVGAVVVVTAGGAVTVLVTVCVVVTVVVPPQPASAPRASPASPIASSRVNRSDCTVSRPCGGYTGDHGVWDLRLAASLSFTSAVARSGTPLSANIVYRTATDSTTPSNVGIAPAPLPHETLTFGGR